MRNVLLVTSSPRGEASHSTKVGRALADRLAAEELGSTVKIRDVVADRLDHVDGDFLAGAFTPDRSVLTPVQLARIEQSDALIDELLAADVVIIASPMINFGLSSQLKAWIDHIARAGKTFRYTASGPEGLAKGKKAYLVAARGGVYSQGPMQALDFQLPYLKAVLGFIGITDVETIAVEGVAIGPEQAEQAVSGALARVEAIGERSLAA